MHLSFDQFLANHYYYSLGVLYKLYFLPKIYYNENSPNFAFQIINFIKQSKDFRFIISLALFY